MLSLLQWAQYAHPIYSKTGDYPPVMKERIGVKSLAQGFHRSRLPELTSDEITYIRGSSDIFGLNHYSSSYVYRNESVYGSFSSPSLQDDLEVLMIQTDDMQIGESEKVKVKNKY